MALQLFAVFIGCLSVGSCLALFDAFAWTLARNIGVAGQAGILGDTPGYKARKRVRAYATSLVLIFLAADLPLVAFSYIYQVLWPYAICVLPLIAVGRLTMFVGFINSDSRKAMAGRLVCMMSESLILLSVVGLVGRFVLSLFGA